MSGNQRFPDKDLIATVRKTVAVFAAEHRHLGRLSDLPPIARLALNEAAVAARSGDHAALIQAVGGLSGPLGCPDDYGRGSPCAIALRALYDAFNAAVASRDLLVEEAGSTENDENDEG
jgi:hypothetical protein